MYKQYILSKVYYIYIYFFKNEFLDNAACTSTKACEREILFFADTFL